MPTRPFLHRPLRTLLGFVASAAIVSAGFVPLVSDPAGADPGLPPVPTNLNAERMDNGIWAVFTPGADNGSPATGWTATCTSSDGGAPLSASTSDPYYHAIQVRPLTFAKHYTCTVHATNAQGDSDESAVSDSVLIVRVPDAPTHVTATSGTTRSRTRSTRPTTVAIPSRTTY